MSNPSKQKGTAYETEVLELLREIWPEAHRTSVGMFSHDITGLPLIVECKKRSTWNVHDWLRKCRTHDPFPWAIFVGDGDRRTTDSVGDVVMFDRAFALELLNAWCDWNLDRLPSGEFDLGGEA